MSGWKYILYVFSVHQFHLCMFWAKIMASSNQYILFIWNWVYRPKSSGEGKTIEAEGSKRTIRKDTLPTNVCCKEWDLMSDLESRPVHGWNSSCVVTTNLLLCSTVLCWRLRFTSPKSDRKIEAAWNDHDIFLPLLKENHDIFVWNNFEGKLFQSAVYNNNVNSTWWTMLNFPTCCLHPELPVHLLTGWHKAIELLFKLHAVPLHF